MIKSAATKLAKELNLGKRLYGTYLPEGFHYIERNYHGEKNNQRDIIAPDGWIAKAEAAGFKQVKRSKKGPLRNMLEYVQEWKHKDGSRIYADHRTPDKYGASVISLHQPPRAVDYTDFY